MDVFMDESGNTGDLARTSEMLDFGGQAVFSLAAVGVADEGRLYEGLCVLRRKHNVQAAELKLSKILKRKPGFALDAINLMVESEIPFFVEVVDKKYQLAVSITNGFIWPPYFNTEESQQTVWLKNVFADFLYETLSDEMFFAFVECMHAPSNAKTGAYFDLLKEFIGRDPRDVAQAIASQVEESKDDFRIMIEQEHEAAHRRFLPIPDVGKRNQEVWLLPNFSSFTNIYARLNLFLSGELSGTRIFHDEQSHFDEIIASAKSQAEAIQVDPEAFKLPYSDYSFEQFSDLFFKASPESAGIQLADLVAGLSMRWYQSSLDGKSSTGVLSDAMDRLLRSSSPSRGVGVNIVGPHGMAARLFGAHG